jgi:predicted PurR-regulated permease PerM
MQSGHPSASVPTWPARQVVAATLVVVLVLALFYLLYRFAEVVFILFVAIVLATAIRPAVEWLKRRGLPPLTSAFFIFTLLIALLIGLGVLVLPMLADQLTTISIELPNYYRDSRLALFNSGNLILQQIAARLPNDITIMPQNQRFDPGQAMDQVGRSLVTAGSLLRNVFQIAAVFILAFFWTLENERTIRYLLHWVPPARREEARRIVNEIEDRVGGFLLGQMALCLVIGGLALAAYVLIGLPNALALAIAAGIMEAVPLIGPAVGAIPALLVALPISPAKAVWVIAATLAIQGLENYLLVPRVMKRSVGVNPIVALLTLMTLTSTFGLAGALIAIPLAAIIQMLLNRYLVSTILPVQPQVNGRDRLSLLRLEAQKLAQDARNQLRQRGTIEGGMDELVDSLEGLALELDQRLTALETPRRVAERAAEQAARRGK